MALAAVLSGIALLILVGGFASNWRWRARSRRLDDANFFGYAADRPDGRRDDGRDDSGSGSDGDGGGGGGD